MLRSSRVTTCYPKISSVLWSLAQGDYNTDGVIFSAFLFLFLTPRSNARFCDAWSIPTLLVPSYPHAFPLVPVDSIIVRAVSLPDAHFDGNTTVTFSTKGIGVPEESSIGLSSDSADAKAIVKADDDLDVGVLQNMTLTFYHCREGSFWNLTSTNTDPDSASCNVCGESAEGNTEVMGARARLIFFGVQKFTKLNRILPNNTALSPYSFYPPVVILPVEDQWLLA